ncbi:ABC transporter ATP-binding protein [Solirhodobacter olei]|uniref:ABC transporter ATP-binding protein n=1 Tax=Solirhodobacter olei TaxID=2493082 RepID=UPI000FDBFF12|nr:ABC transporter ATP-binding protein [Solirhodobacter olei]
MLDLTGLSLHFGALRVLDGLDLKVERGEVLGVLGPNGAGKTTLFNVITGVHRPTAGEIRFEGRVIGRQRSWTRCRAGIGRTFQVPKPFTGMTVFDNVLTAAVHGAGLSFRTAARRAGETLELTGLASRSELEAGALSLLDLKRLELAKAVACGPRLLLLDEIAGGLTDRECGTLLSILTTLREREITIVWIEHVLHALKSAATRLAVLHGGRFIADGAPETVLADPTVQDVYLGAVD